MAEGYPVSHRMSTTSAIELLYERHGPVEARRMVTLEQRNARRARSRKRFDFWAAVAGEMDQLRPVA
jgi:hypothetical protein